MQESNIGIGIGIYFVSILNVTFV